MYGAKHIQFIYSFEGERKKSQFGKSIQEVINMHHLSFFNFSSGWNFFEVYHIRQKGPSL